jgi:two-component system sensor histidine kinase KdpD
VEERLDQSDGAGSDSEATPQGRRLDDAVIIYVSDDPSTAMLIRRGKRVADIIHADCFAVFISDEGDLQKLLPEKREAIERHLSFARNLHINTQILAGSDHASELVKFARSHNARQIFLPRLLGKGMDRFVGKSLVNQVVSMASDMEITIVADRRQTANSVR